MGWSPALRVQRAGTMRRFAQLAAGEVIQYIRYMGWSLALRVHRAGTMRKFAQSAAGEVIQYIRVWMVQNKVKSTSNCEF